MKTIMSERKNKLDEINSRLDIAEEKISDFKGIAIEIIQTQTAKNKRMKSERISRLWDNFKRCTIHLIGGPEEDRTGRTEKNI